MVTYDHEPHGLLEKTTSLWHSVPRGLSADLMRFKAFVEISEQDTEMQEEPEEQADDLVAHSATLGLDDEDERAE
jgi:hypothetical protein